jgi:hypothetical protein
VFYRNRKINNLVAGIPSTITIIRIRIVINHMIVHNARLDDAVAQDSHACTSYPPFLCPLFVLSSRDAADLMNPSGDTITRTSMMYEIGVLHREDLEAHHARTRVILKLILKSTNRALKIHNLGVIVEKPADIISRIDCASEPDIARLGVPKIDLVIVYNQDFAVLKRLNYEWFFKFFVRRDFTMKRRQQCAKKVV